MGAQVSTPGVRLAVIRALKDAITEAEREAKEEWQAELDRLKSPEIDGVKLTTIYEIRGRTVASVVDEGALMSFVLANYPTEVEQIRRIRPAFLNAILEKSKYAGEAMAPDGTLDVPGIAVSVGEPSVGVKKPSEEALDLIVQLHQSGLISLDGSVLKEIQA